METLLQNRNVNIDSPEIRRRLNILVTLLDRCDSVEERVSLTEEQLSLTEERVSLTEEHLGLVKERQDELQRLVEEVIENLKENRGKARKIEHNTRARVDMEFLFEYFNSIAQ